MTEEQDMRVGDFAADVMTDLERLRRWCSRNLSGVDFELLGEPEPLSGGLLNHVWKVPASPTPLVFKWSPPYVASAPEIALDPGRSGFEVRALTYLADAPEMRSFARDAGVSAATLVGATSSPWVVVTEHVEAVGDISQACTSEGFIRDAERLGQWLATLHDSTSLQREVSRDLSSSMNNLAVQQTRAEVQYGALADWLDAREEPVAAKALRTLGARFLEPGECLVMGDLWPPSVLVTARDRLVVIDWEFSHYGHPAQDIGHLCAHFWSRWQRTGERRSREQLDAFLSGYASRRALSADAVRCSRQHFGAEILARTVGAFATQEIDDEGVENLVRDAIIHTIASCERGCFNLVL